MTSVVSDAMVEAAFDAYHNFYPKADGMPSWHAMRAALSAALPLYRPIPAGTVVKPLEWRVSNVAHRHIADHPWGEYAIVCDYREGFATTHGWFSGGQLVWVDSLDEAKAAAQTDFEQRIRSALQPIPAAQDVSPVVVWCDGYAAAQLAMDNEVEVPSAREAFNRSRFAIGETKP